MYHGTILLVGLLVPLLGLICLCEAARVRHAVKVFVEQDYSSPTGLKVVRRSRSPVAVATLRDSIDSEGWVYLTIKTMPGTPDELQAFAAGMAEGHATQKYIWMMVQNTMKDFCTNRQDYCSKLALFIAKNNKFILNQVASNPGSAYWKQANLTYIQLQGLMHGYNMASPKNQTLDEFTLQLLNLNEEIYDINQSIIPGFPRRVIGDGACSAIIKLTPNNKDLLISHVTWTDYDMMLRIYKHYSYSYATEGLHGHSLSFSSYPGILISMDDFYQLSSGLVVQETTINNENPDLWRYITPESVLMWMRVTVANRLADSGPSWVYYFSLHNSGTYNNQWMILDYKLFTPGQPVKPDTLWVVEQIPGKVESADVTYNLEKATYWASYNIPFFREIYELSGFSESRKKFGSFFDYNLSPRAQIFLRDHSKVVDMPSLYKLMRYNDYQNDPLSRCNCTPPYSSENAISARCELNPADGIYPFEALGHRKHGATDFKATNTVRNHRLSSFAVSGPTFDQQPPFTWSRTEWPRPLGHPDVFSFDPVEVTWDDTI